MLNRRQLLKSSPLVAMAPSVPAFLANSVHAGAIQSDGRILVVVQLDGGNDGINTVVPYADEAYAKHRPKLQLKENNLVKLNDRVGLNSALRAAADLLEDGRLAIIQGVGYPNPNRSHDVSMAIWQTARFDETEHDTFGWIGRATDALQNVSAGTPHSILLGNEAPPVTLRGRRSTSVTFSHPSDLKLKPTAALLSNPAITKQESLLAFAQRTSLDAQATAELIEDATDEDAAMERAYPKTKLAERLKAIGQLIKSDFHTPIYYAIQPGYDTHSAQQFTHRRLLQELSGALKSFLDDMKESGLDDRVVVLCFSEFGRRVAENASEGTDHGTAGPVFLAGSPVLPGLVAEVPSLAEADLTDGDLTMGIDFRRIYASVLESWLNISPQLVLQDDFEQLDLFR